MYRLVKSKVVQAALILIALATTWQLAVTPRWKARLRPGWSWDAVFIGSVSVTDAKGTLPSTNSLASCERSARVLPERAGSGTVLVGDSYIVRDPVTGAKTWEYRYQAQVDPMTGRHAAKEYRGDYYVFPRSVQKQTYRLRFNYIKGIPLAFEGEEALADIPTYIFGYKGRGEYTESYAGTAEFPGVRVKRGQEIRCAGDQFQFRAWVEPVTGEILRSEESCSSGDYIYDKARNKPVVAVGRWTAVTADDDVILRAEVLRHRKQLYLWMVRNIPRILFAAGGLLAICGLVQARPQRDAYA